MQKLAATRPIAEGNSVDMNLQLYDQYKRLERGELQGGPRTPGLRDPADIDYAGPGTEVKGSRAYG